MNRKLVLFLVSGEQQQCHRHHETKKVRVGRREGRRASGMARFGRRKVGGCRVKRHATYEEERRGVG
jgi:hypothetical protein